MNLPTPSFGERIMPRALNYYNKPTLKDLRVLAQLTNNSAIQSSLGYLRILQEHGKYYAKKSSAHKFANLEANLNYIVSRQTWSNEKFGLAGGGIMGKLSEFNQFIQKEYQIITHENLSPAIQQLLLFLPPITHPEFTILAFKKLNPVTNKQIHQIKELKGRFSPEQRGVSHSEVILLRNAATGELELPHTHKTLARFLTQGIVEISFFDNESNCTAKHVDKTTLLTHLPSGLTLICSQLFKAEKPKISFKYAQPFIPFHHQREPTTLLDLIPPLANSFSTLLIPLDEKGKRLNLNS